MKWRSDKHFTDVNRSVCYKRLVLSKSVAIGLLRGSTLNRKIIMKKTIACLFVTVIGLIATNIPVFSQDQTVSGNLIVTGTGDFQGNTFNIGTSGTASPGVVISFTDAISSSGTATFSIGGSRANQIWLWQHNSISGLLPMMQLDNTNALTLFNATTNTASIVLDPANGQITINGQTIGGGSGIWTTSGSNVVLSTGKVGIGVSSPTHLLDTSNAFVNSDGSASFAAGAMTIDSSGHTKVNKIVDGSGHTILNSTFGPSPSYGPDTDYVLNITSGYGTGNGAHFSLQGDKQVGIVLTSNNSGSIWEFGTNIDQSYDTGAFLYQAGAGVPFYSNYGDIGMGGSDAQNNPVVKITGGGAFAFGPGSQATGLYSLALGEYTTASGDLSTATGNTTTAAGYNQFVIGQWNISQGDPNNWVATDDLFQIGNGVDGDHPANALVVKKNGEMDVYGTADPTTPVIVLDPNNAQILMNGQPYGGSWATSGTNTIFSSGNVAIGTFSSDPTHLLEVNGNVSFDNGNIVSDGSGSLAVATLSLCGSSLSGGGIFACGDVAQAHGNHSIAIGSFAIATGDYSLACAQNSFAVGDASVAIGYGSAADASNSMAYGNAAEAYASYSTAGGVRSLAYGAYSTTLGPYSITNGDFSISAGFTTTTAGYCQFVIGQWNNPQGDPNNWYATDDLFQIGNGVDGDHPSNALVVKKNGDTRINGNTMINGGLIVTGTAITSGTTTKIVSTGTNQLVLIPEQGDLSMGAFTAGAQPVVP